MPHAFSSSFAQSTGITDPGAMFRVSACMLMCVKELAVFNADIQSECSNVLVSSPYSKRERASLFPGTAEFASHIGLKHFGTRDTFTDIFFPRTTYTPYAN